MASLAPESGAPARVAPTYPSVTRSDPARFVKQADGSYLITVQISPYALSDADLRHGLMSWTTDHWSTINYYIQNSQHIGLGNKVLGVSKDLHKELFGDKEPFVELLSVHGSQAVLSFEVSRNCSRYCESLDKFAELRDEAIIGAAIHRRTEEKNPTAAIVVYREAIERVMALQQQYPLDDPNVRFAGAPAGPGTLRAGELKPLDRLTALLEERRRFAELIDAVDSFFRCVPRRPELAMMQRIAQRRERAELGDARKRRSSLARPFARDDLHRSRRRIQRAVPVSI